MTNKEMIKKLKDYAELAWAAYGYYDLMTNKSNDFYTKVENDESKQDNNSFRKSILIQDIMDITYKNYEVYQYDTFLHREIKVGTLEGDFSPTQAKNFFEKYELLIHQPNTSNGFSATLFQDKESKEFILAFRGTESFTRDMFITDFQLLLSSLTNQYQNEMRL